MYTYLHNIYIYIQIYTNTQIYIWIHIHILLYRYENAQISSIINHPSSFTIMISSKVIDSFKYLYDFFDRLSFFLNVPANIVYSMSCFLLDDIQCSHFPGEQVFNKSNYLCVQYAVLYVLGCCKVNCQIKNYGAPCYKIASLQFILDIQTCTDSIRSISAETNMSQERFFRSVQKRCHLK